MRPEVKDEIFRQSRSLGGVERKQKWWESWCSKLSRGKTNGFTLLFTKLLLLGLRWNASCCHKVQMTLFLKNSCRACLINTGNLSFLKHLCAEQSSVLQVDTSLPGCSFPDCRNHSVFLPKGLLGHVILGKTCLFLLKRIYLSLWDHFTLLTARVLWASSAKASFHDLMDQVSWHPIWHGVRVLQGTLGNLLLSHVLRSRHVLCQINLL